MITIVSSFPSNPTNYVLKRIRSLSTLAGHYKLFVTDTTVRIILNDSAQFNQPCGHECSMIHLVSLEMYGESKRIVGFPSEAHANMWQMQYSDWLDGGEVVNHPQWGWIIIKPRPTYDFDKDLIQPVANKHTKGEL